MILADAPTEAAERKKKNRILGHVLIAVVLRHGIVNELALHNRVRGFSQCPSCVDIPHSEIPQYFKNANCYRLRPALDSMVFGTFFFLVI